MAIRSGLGGQVGVAKETTYGTYVAPDHWIEFGSESLVKNVNRIDGGGMAAGRFARLGTRRIETNNDGSGTLNAQVPTKGFGVLLENLFGGTVTPAQQAGTAAYLQTHVLADNFGKSLTIQKGVPSAANGTAYPFNFVGSKVNSMEFTCGVDEDLQVAIDVDSQTVQESSGLVTASYPSGLSGFSFTQGVFKTGANVGAAAATDGVRSVTAKIERPMKTDRFTYNQGALKLEPIMNDYVDVSGSFDIDFMTKADFIDRFTANTGFALVWEFVGATIASTYKFTFHLEFPLCYLDGATPNMDGPDVVQTTIPFVARSDGTNSVVTCTYTSTDVTV